MLNKPLTFDAEFRICMSGPKPIRYKWPHSHTPMVIETQEGFQQTAASDVDVTGDSNSVSQAKKSFSCQKTQRGGRDLFTFCTGCDTVYKYCPPRSSFSSQFAVCLLPQHAQVPSVSLPLICVCYTRTLHFFNALQI